MQLPHQNEVETRQATRPPHAKHEAAFISESGRFRVVRVVTPPSTLFCIGPGDLLTPWQSKAELT
jgi:hypothetical protein